MSHTFFVSLAYGASAVALAGLIVWVVADHRARSRELAMLEKSGVRRRSREGAEPSA